MHLLMETAMGDSQHYEVLSPEDIDTVKKELSVVTSRIEATKKKLVLETKLRDATHSINRLYLPKGGDRSANGSPAPSDVYRRPGSKESGVSAGKTDSDAGESARKCEELATDLWNLEKREQDIRRLLMEHTAGVLQMTHKGYLKKELSSQDPDNGDRTPKAAHSHQKSGEFGEQSYYRPYSQIGAADVDHIGKDDSTLRADFEQHNRLIVEVEAKVEELNTRLRDMILDMKPRKEDLPDPPRGLAADPDNPNEILWEQIDFLDQCLDTMRALHANPPEGKEINLAAEEKLEILNTHLFDIMTQSSEDENTDYTSPPDASGESLQDQLDYLEGGLRAVERRMMQLVDEAQTSSTKLVSYQERAEQYVSVIGALWDILTASDDRSRHFDQESDETEELSTDEFSLQAFSAKVQELRARSIELVEHKAVLTRQVQQQRELSETADTAKDARMTAMRTEIEDATRQLEVRGKEAEKTRDAMTALVAELEAARHARTLLEERKAIEGNEALKAEKEARRQAEDAAEQKIQRLMAQLEETRETTAAMELNALTLKTDLEEKSQAAAAFLSSIKNLESEVVRLQTELTFAKAELDGAYGTRAQRAAEVAADPALQKELEELKRHNSNLSADMASLKADKASRGGQSAELQAQISTLQQELSETIADYEAMTKASIEFEKEREQLENLVDMLRDRIESLDSQISDDRVQMLGTKSPGGSSVSGPTSNTSTMVLKNEFKKMMRETRAENARTLRVSPISIKVSILLTYT